MKVCCVAIVLAAGLAVGACSEKPRSEFATQENEGQPREDEIAEDCVGFVHATKIVPANPNCAGCSGDAREALSFRQMRVDRISCSATACEITVTLRASFNPGPGGTFSGGLTGWIPEQQRLEFINGHAPEGEQDYRVKINYQRRSGEWRAIEFDRADPKS